MSIGALYQGIIEINSSINYNSLFSSLNKLRVDIIVSISSLLNSMHSGEHVFFIFLFFLLDVYLFHQHLNLIIIYCLV